VLRRLRDRFRVGLVTNGAPDLQRRKVAVTGLREHFDAVVASGDIGVGIRTVWVQHGGAPADGVVTDLWQLPGLLEN
jgi:FMN phosphatase YigB (HAD superfamily)